MSQTILRSAGGATRCARMTAALAVFALSCAAQNQLNTLYSFSGGAGGANPSAALTIGPGGILLGTTPYGGAMGYGTVFELTPGSGGSWSQTVIYSFLGGNDGANPGATLTPGQAGRIFGATAAGGAFGNGVVFELIPPRTGTLWTESVLYTFTGGADGGIPQGSLSQGAGGTLYGTTFGGGSGSAGTVFQLTPPARGGAAWTEAVLYNFSGGKDGSGPQGGVVLNNGHLYGTTCCGTAGGTVFRMSPTGTGTWNKANIFSFIVHTLGAFPYGGLVLDAKGVVYGTTSAGGKYGAGIVFSLTPPTTSSQPYTLTTIHSFTGGSDGGAPYGSLSLGPNGVLYGTVTTGGTFGAGAVLQFSPPVSGSGSWTETVLYNFTGANDGSQPFAGVIPGANNTLYGATVFDGVAGYGTVFELVL